MRVRPKNTLMRQHPASPGLMLLAVSGVIAGSLACGPCAGSQDAAPANTSAEASRRGGNEGAAALHAAAPPPAPEQSEAEKARIRRRHAVERHPTVEDVRASLEMALDRLEIMSRGPGCLGPMGNVQGSTVDPLYLRAGQLEASGVQPSLMPAAEKVKGCTACQARALELCKQARAELRKWDRKRKPPRVRSRQDDFRSEPVVSSFAFEDAGKAWPLTVEVGRVGCERGAAYFTAPDGTEYALNAAATKRRFPKIEPLVDQEDGGDLMPLVQAAEALCQ
jgi:hypothetical protein